MKRNATQHPRLLKYTRYGTYLSGYFLANYASLELCEIALVQVVRLFRFFVFPILHCMVDVRYNHFEGFRVRQVKGEEGH